MSTSTDEGRANTTDTTLTLLIARFPDLSIKLKTVEFLQSATDLVHVIERLGKVFAPVTYDMYGNIRKLRQKYEKDVERHHYLEDMILQEQQEGELVATDALQWLRRTMHFITTFFQCVIDDSSKETYSQDLTQFVKKAYTDTLERYHGWLGTQLFNVLSRFVPDRRHFLYILAFDKYDREDDVLRDIRTYNSKLTTCVLSLTQFYSEYHLESLITV